MHGQNHIKILLTFDPYIFKSY